MNTSKHLWSGDWERQSEQPPVAAVPTDPVTPPAPEPEPRERRSRRRGLTTLGVIVAVLVIVGVVLALTLPGGSKTAQRTTAQANPFSISPGQGQSQSGGAPLQGQSPSQGSTTTPTTSTPTVTQAPAPVQIGPTYSWLGMQVSATPNGVAVATVTIGGAADAAGLNPGDVITAVNQTMIGSIAELQAAVNNLKLGTQFQLTVDRGTTPVTISATLSNRLKRQS